MIHIAKRKEMPLLQSMAIRGLSVVLALVICGVITTILTGLNPIDVYVTFFSGAFGSARKIWILLQEIAILLCVSLALAPAFKMKFWNLGGEGQVLMGALATAACMILLGDKIPNGLLILCMVVYSIVAGAVWGLIPRSSRPMEHKRDAVHAYDELRKCADALPTSSLCGRYRDSGK